MLSSKKCNPIVTEFFIKRRKLSISLFFIARLNSTHYFLMKILNKRELQQTAFNHLTDIDFQGFIKSLVQNHILFWFLILPFHQIILYILERIFYKQFKS